MFKRRNKRSYLQIAREIVYPRGGWARAFYYVRHRLNRLPDSPERIARGVAAGVFSAFTPFFGLHFVVAAVVAKAIRGNILAALMGTFFGNPLTYVPIAVISMRLGGWFLDRGDLKEIDHGLMSSFASAGGELWANFWAIFTDARADWSQLIEFYRQVFLPYMVGCILPGIVAGVITFYLSVPVIKAYQARRSERIRKKMKAHRKVAQRMAVRNDGLAKD